MQVRQESERCSRKRTRDGVFDLNTRVDLDKVVPALLINQELGRTGVSVVDGFRKLDGIAQDGLSDVLRQVRCWSDLDDLLVSSLDGTVSLVQVNTVAVTICQELDFDVSRVVQESYAFNKTRFSCRYCLVDSETYAQ